jgi:hypothetical protein
VLFVPDVQHRYRVGPPNKYRGWVGFVIILTKAPSDRYLNLTG